MVFGLRLGLPKKASAAHAAAAAAAAADGGSVSPKASKQQGATGTPSPAGKSGKAPLTVNEFVSRTKKSREKGLEPTKPELIAYARYLGIDPVLDADLMWIADEALTAPLPAEWTEHHDSAERIFYYNTQTHGSSWTHPLEQLHRDTYKMIVDFRNGKLSKEDQMVELEKLRQRCEEAEHDAHNELQLWSEHTDDQGQTFFYNKEEQRSVWTDPRPARCHSLYLEMKALRALGGHCGHSGLVQLSPSAGGPLGFSGSGYGAKEEKKSAAGRDKLTSSAGRDKQSEKENMDVSSMMNSRGFSKKADPLASSNGMGVEGDPLLKKPSFLDKPALSKVEEARAALNMGLGPSLRPMKGDALFGDINSVGRAKVRAGIRLEPLKLN